MEAWICEIMEKNGAWRPVALGKSEYDATTEMMRMEKLFPENTFMVSKYVRTQQENAVDEVGDELAPEP